MEGLSGGALQEAMAKEINGQLCLASLLEQLPSSDNRVTLAEEKDAVGIPRPEIHYALGSYEKAGIKKAREVFESIYQKLGGTKVHHSDSYFGAGHIMGTYRMGTNPKTSVVDPNLCSHDHKNLYLLGTGVFPTGGTANPTLTMVSLVERCAHTIT